MSNAISLEAVAGIDVGSRVRLASFPQQDAVGQVFVVMEVLPSRGREDDRLFEVSNGVDTLDVYADEIELFE